MKPSVLRRVVGSLLKAASLADVNACCISSVDPNSNAKFFELYRYRIARSAAVWCIGDGFVRNSASLLAVLAPSARVMAVAYVREPIFR